MPGTVIHRARLTAPDHLTKVRQSTGRASSGVRHFNRGVTERVGALSDDVSRSRAGRSVRRGCCGRSAPTGGREVRASCGHRLGIDAGYAGRLLRSLEREGMIAIEGEPSRSRVRRARLTRAGVAERAELDGAPTGCVVSMLESLGERRRARLGRGHGPTSSGCSAPVVRSPGRGADERGREMVHAAVLRGAGCAISPPGSIPPQHPAEICELRPPAGCCSWRGLRPAGRVRALKIHATVGRR